MFALPHAHTMHYTCAPNCSTQENQQQQSCVCLLQSWFFHWLIDWVRLNVEQRDIDCQQTKVAGCPPQLWPARSRRPDMEAPAHVSTCRRSMTDRKPVKFTQHRWNVIELSGSCHNTRCCIVNYLQFLHQAVVDTVQQSVAVIQAGTHRCDG